MTMMEAVRSCFENFASFSGRARRAEFWKFHLFNVLADFVCTVVGLLLSALFRSLGTAALILGLVGLYNLITIIPSLSVSVRRLHDIGKSGAYLFFLLLPVIGDILLLVWTFQGGQYGDNQYGPDPKSGGSYAGMVVHANYERRTDRAEQRRDRSRERVERSPRERDQRYRERDRRSYSRGSRSDERSFPVGVVIAIAGAVILLILLLVLIFGGSNRGNSSRGGSRRTTDRESIHTLVSDSYTEHVHSWSPATCERAAMCSLCGEQRGVALGHDWEPATYDHPRRCRVCGATEGDPLQSISTETATTAAPVIVSSGQKPKLSEKSTVDLITEDRSNSKYVSVSVAHSPSLSACESVVKKLRNAGYNAFIYEIPGKGGYGIHIGLYGSVDDAEIMAQYLHEQPAVQGAKLDHAYSVNAYLSDAAASAYANPYW